MFRLPIICHFCPASARSLNFSLGLGGGFAPSAILDDDNNNSNDDDDEKSFCSRPLNPYSHVLQGRGPDSSFILITTANIVVRTLITIIILIFLIAATDIIPILLILISRCTGWNSIRLLVAAAKWKISAR